MIQLHGTCVELEGHGVLLRGPPGSGKSDLALRLIDGGARLVADDRVDLRAVGDTLMARAPRPIAGKLEVRGLGIVELPSAAEVPLGLVVDLVTPEAVERLPESAFCSLLERRIRLIRLAPFEASAAAKLRLAARTFVRTIMAP
ncbi:MAG TPA: HPr kinase/phosphatase C-terminal domain-containing protein [Alphaproteobacteria bacterium]|nr:HPr kinase/phosphatase C-terminal domain-containing protein [Alphaproteobacteria bacterium]